MECPSVLDRRVEWPELLHQLSFQPSCLGKVTKRKMLKLKFAASFCRCFMQEQSFGRRVLSLYCTIENSGQFYIYSDVAFSNALERSRASHFDYESAALSTGTDPHYRSILEFFYNYLKSSHLIYWE